MVYSGQVGDWLELRHVYEASPWLDGVVYISVFTAMAHLALRKHFSTGGRPVMALSAATGLALSIGASYAANRVGFQLSDLGGFAWLVLILTCLFVIGGVFKRVPWESGRVVVRDREQDSGIASSRLHRHSSGEGGDLVTAQQIEESIHTLLCQALDLVERRRRMAQIKVLLAEIKRRERMVQRLYAHVLKYLAKRRWMMTRVRRRVSPRLRDTMVQATENISSFERLMDVAQSAAVGKNWVLLKGSLERLISLEEQSIQLAAWIREVMSFSETSTRERAPPKDIEVSR